jgi:hypothetical protein|tara:strand:- start:15925 stop:16038 length:114 start_codon:yes stop_codon:yes gene_type:complete
MIFSPEREQRDAALELLAYAVGKVARRSEQISERLSN